MGLDTTSGNPHDNEMSAVGGSDGTNAYILKVDSNGAITVSAIAPGVAATSLGKAEDAAHTSGDVGTMALAVRNNTATALATTNLDYIPLTTDTNGALWESLATLIAGENQTLNRLMTAPSYSYVHFTGDTAVKSGAGIIHTVTLSSDASATAGTLIIYDNTAESGTIIAQFTFIAAYEAPISIILDAAFSTGCYAGLTTTGDVDVTVTYL